MPVSAPSRSRSCSVFPSLAFALCSAAGVSADEQPGAKEPIFSNSYVEAYRVTLDPGEGLGPHTAGERIVYSLSDYTIRWTEAGTTTTKSWREGEVHEHQALDHAIENVGNTIADFLVVERTDATLPAQPDGGDAAAVPGGYAALIAELDSARVLRVALPAGAEQPLHAGSHRLVYSLNEYAIDFATAGGETSGTEMEGGDIHWHDAGPHAVRNTGEETARFVIFAFR